MRILGISENNINLSGFYLPFVMFLCSLDSFFRARAIVAIFLLFPLLFLRNKVNIGSWGKGFIIFVFFVFILYTVFAFVFPTVFLEIKADEVNFVFKVIDRLSLCFLAFLIVTHYGRNDVMLRSVKFTANVHVVLFAIQFLCYYMLGKQLDYLSFFSSDLAQRNWMEFGGDNVFRASGLYFEPSNYAAYMAIYIAIMIFMGDVIRWYKYVFPVSMMLTFSSAAFFMGAISFFAIFIHSTKRVKFIHKLLVFILLIISVSLFVIPQLARFSAAPIDQNVNAGLRLKLIATVFESTLSSSMTTVFGTGIYSYSKAIYDLENTGFGRVVASVQDASMFVYLFMSFGLFGIFFVFWMLHSSRGASKKLAVISVLLSKMSFLFPIFIFFVVSILLSKFRHLRNG